jgi:hypothetical protein
MPRAGRITLIEVEKPKGVLLGQGSTRSFGPASCVDSDPGVLSFAERRFELSSKQHLNVTKIRHNSSTACTTFTGFCVTQDLKSETSIREIRNVGAAMGNMASVTQTTATESKCELPVLGGRISALTNGPNLPNCKRTGEMLHRTPVLPGIWRGLIMNVSASWIFWIFCLNVLVYIYKGICLP